MPPVFATHISPVFLLTGVASLIGAVAGRLARIIDRARALEERLDAGTHRYPDLARLELHRLKVRGGLVNSSILLLTLCAVAIAVTILGLFIGPVVLTVAYTLLTRWVSQGEESVASRI